MRKKIFQNKSLLLILILAAGLRLTAIDNFPAGFTADEAVQGYTAYSILKTGRDEWGEFLPLNPRSFGDFKPPLYTYLTIPSVAIFGLNELAVRLPSAILGILAVLATYLLTQELFKKEKLALLAAFFLAISPWHLGFSRSAIEANLTAFFFPLGFYFFWRGLRQTKYFSLAAFFWGLNLYSYHSARLFTFLFAFFITWQQRKKLFSRGKKIFAAGLVAAIFILPVFFSLVRGGGEKRFLDVSLFSPTDHWEEVSRQQFESPLPQPWPRIFNNKVTWVMDKFIKNYLSYFSFTFLFAEGSPDTTYANLPGRGLIYLWQLPLLLAAAYFVYKRQEKRTPALLLWLFLAGLPAALSKESLHANRASTFLPLWSILSAYGAFFAWKRLAKRFSGLTQKAVKLGSFVVVFVSLVFFLEHYFFHAPFKFAQGLSYGYRELIEYLEGLEDDYDKIVMTKRFSEPQIFVAFYKKMDPSRYQAASQEYLLYEKEDRVFLDQLGTYRLGKYEFRDLNWGADRELQNTLVVGGTKDFDIEKVFPQKTILYPNGQAAWLIVDPEAPRRNEK